MSIGNIHTEAGAEKIFVATWTIKDILWVTFCIIGFPIVFYVTLLALFGDSKTTIRIARYVTSLLVIFFPLFWINKKYGLSKEALGLKKGELRLPSLISIGIVVGLIYPLLVRLTPLWHSNPVLSNKKISDYYVDLILLPISVDEFVSLVLTPIGEEILHRGFIYAYLRRRFGINWGLILQAIIFGLLHFDFFYGDAFYLFSNNINKLFIGLILGILYEKTGSIYPSIICHGVINYLVVVLSISWK